MAIGFDVASTYFTPIWTRFLIAPLSLSFHRASPRLGRCAKHNSKTGFPGLEAQHLVFVYVHIVWFGVWIVLNTGRVGVAPFDPFPYGLLTMVVSLEAIFLSTLVLISQNRLSEESEHRADLALHIGLLTEYELTRVLHMLDAIQDKMGIDNDADSELADLEMETKPEDVLAEIERLQQRARRRTKPPA
jgi:uncharacterized membrane protein